MSTALLDLNVLLALAWPSHEHHDPAHSWFQRRGRKMRWATCSITQLGFVRLSANPRVVDPSSTPQQAAKLLRRILAQPNHNFWADDLDASRDDDWPPGWVRGHRQITDAHLVRLTVRHQGMLATFDRALYAASGPKYVELIPADTEIDHG